METEELKAELRKAFAAYRSAEGCSCCRNTQGYEAAEERLAALLDVPKYSDGSGFDFYRFKEG